MAELQLNFQTGDLFCDEKPCVQVSDNVAIIISECLFDLGFYEVESRGVWRYFLCDKLSVFGLDCAVTVRVVGDKVGMVDLNWLEGDVNRYGYGANGEMLLSEKRFWVDKIQGYSKTKARHVNNGYDEFPFAWGKFFVIADLRSSIVYASIRYC